MVFLIIAGTTQAVLSHWGFVDAPSVGSVYFLGMIVVTACDLTLETKRAARRFFKMGRTSTPWRMLAHRH